MEPITTAGIITLVVITGAKLSLSIANRIKKSKCTDSKGREMEVNFGSGDESEDESKTPPHWSRGRSRSRSRHSHGRLF